MRRASRPRRVALDIGICGEPKYCDSSRRWDIECSDALPDSRYLWLGPLWKRAPRLSGLRAIQGSPFVYHKPAVIRSEPLVARLGFNSAAERAGSDEHHCALLLLKVGAAPPVVLAVRRIGHLASVSVVACFEFEELLLILAGNIPYASRVWRPRSAPVSPFATPVKLGETARLAAVTSSKATASSPRTFTGWRRTG